MVTLEKLKKVDFGNLSKEEIKECKRKAKEWSKIFEKVFLQLLVNYELYGCDSVLVKSELGTGFSIGKLPKGTTYGQAYNAIVYLLNDLAWDLDLRDE